MIALSGLAVSDKSGFLASSLCVITEYNDEKLIQKIADKVKETKAEIIVVGLPRNMDGSEGESAHRAREIAARLTQVSGIPHYMQDERGTTIPAHSYLSAEMYMAKNVSRRWTP